LLGATALAIAACGDDDTAAAVTDTGAASVGAGGSDANRAPVISGEPLAAVAAGRDYEFVPTASDPDGDPIIYGIDGKPAWMFFDTKTGRLWGRPRAGDVGVHRGIVVWVTDGADTTLLPAIDIEVLPQPPVLNQPPEISGEPDDAVEAGQPYEFVPVIADADGDPLTLEIENPPVWAEFDTTTGRVSGTPTLANVGVASGIVIRVSDGTDTAELPPFIVAVNAPAADNSPPVISGFPNPDVLVGEPWLFRPDASDPDGDSLSFFVFNAPAWMSLDAASGRLSGTPGPLDTGTHFGIRMAVSDGQSWAVLPRFSVQVVAVNLPPTIGGNPDDSVLVGELFEFVPTAQDLDGDPLVFAIAGLPGWLDFDASTGRLSGTPGVNDEGVHADIVITVSDGKDDVELPAFQIEVIGAGDVNTPPAISGTPSASATAGQFYDFVPSVSDADGDNLSFVIVSRPSWADFDPAIGRLSGTPDAGDAGVDAGIIIRVSDGLDSTDLGPFTIVVNNPVPTNSAPSITGVPDPNVVVGQSWSFQPQAFDADGDTLSFQVFNAPSWTSFDATTGRLSGAPGSGDGGTHGGITIVVSDGQESTSLPAFAVEVIVPNEPPVITGSPATSVEAGEFYSFTPTVDDPDNDALSFSIVNRPGWASFNSGTGRLSGTPNAAQARTYTGIRITVSDGNASDTLGPFSITVAIGNRAPTISGSASDTALVGQNFSFTPTASDPDGDDLSFSGSGVPSWAALDADSGTLSGTPGAGDVGFYSGISIAVSDGELDATLAPFSISVVAIATGTATLSWTPPTENTDGSPLTDLAGYNLYWGTESGTYSSAVTLNGTGVTSYVVENLLSGATYYFAITAFNGEGMESSFSNEASKTIP
jgi:hypothetical protein